MIAQGISGTVSWTLDDEGTLFFKPVNGDEGTFVDTKNASREWKPYSKFINQIKTCERLSLAKDSSFMFDCCSSLTNLDLTNFDTSNVTNMSCMFSGCYWLTNLNLTNFDTSRVKNMSWMFRGCKSLTNLNVNNFDTNKVTDIRYMFQGCSHLVDLNLSNWKARHVTNMQGLFYGCSSLENLDLSNFDTTNAIFTGWLFRDCFSLTRIRLSSNCRPFLRELPTNETCNLSSKYHKIGLTYDYPIWMMKLFWPSFIAGSWSRKNYKTLF